MADEAIKYLKALNAAGAHKPFSSITFPVEPIRLTTRRRVGREVQGKFDMAGMPCASRSSPTKTLGRSPAKTKLTDGPDILPKWETLSADQKSSSHDKPKCSQATPPIRTTRSAV